MRILLLTQTVSIKSIKIKKMFDIFDYSRGTSGFRNYISKYRIGPLGLWHKR